MPVLGKIRKKWLKKIWINSSERRNKNNRAGLIRQTICLAQTQTNDLLNMQIDFFPLPGRDFLLFSLFLLFALHDYSWLCKWLIVFHQPIISVDWWRHGSVIWWPSDLKLIASFKDASRWEETNLNIQMRWPDAVGYWSAQLPQVAWSPPHALLAFLVRISGDGMPGIAWRPFIRSASSRSASTRFHFKFQVSEFPLKCLRFSHVFLASRATREAGKYWKCVCVCVELSYRAGLLLETCGWGASLSAAVGEGKASHRWQRPIVATADANRCQLLHIYTRSYCLAASCYIWLLSLLLEPDLQSTITGSFLHRISSNCSNR